MVGWDSTVDCGSTAIGGASTVLSVVVGGVSVTVVVVSEAVGGTSVEVVGGSVAVGGTSARVGGGGDGDFGGSMPSFLITTSVIRAMY